MKKSNVFRFVSIRAPRRRRREDDNDIREDDVAKDVEREIDSERHNNPDEAPRKVGSDLMASDDYFVHNASWETWLPLTSKARAVVFEAADNQDSGAFEEAYDELLDAVLAENPGIESFMAGDVYGELKRTLWTSFYGNVLNPDVRPADREDIVVWLRFFSLAETLLEGEEAFEDRAESIDRARPAVPLSFFRFAQEFDEGPTEEPPDDSKPVNDRVKDWEEEISRLKQTRKILKEMMTERMARFRSEAREHRPTKSEDTDANRVSASLDSIKSQLQSLEERVEGNLDPEQLDTLFQQISTPRPGINEGRGPLPSGAPWRLEVDDLSEHDVALHTLKELRLDLDSKTVPAIVHVLEERIADLYARVAASKDRPDVRTLGKHAIRARRS